MMKYLEKDYFSPVVIMPLCFAAQVHLYENSFSSLRQVCVVLV
jgi:hypothetical protein